LAVLAFLCIHNNNKIKQDIQVYTYLSVLLTMNKHTPNSKQEHRKRKQKVLFDSLTLHFSFVTFIEQFLNHMLFPLLLPWMVYSNGWNCLIAQGFIPVKITTRDVLLTLWNWGSPMVFYFVVILHFGDCSHVQLSIVFPVIFYCMHRAMVALKYATLSPSELRRLLRVSAGRIF
jgi:hypothetical protein